MLFLKLSTSSNSIRAKNEEVFIWLTLLLFFILYLCEFFRVNPLFVRHVLFSFSHFISSVINWFRSEHHSMYRKITVNRSEMWMYKSIPTKI